MQQVVLDGVTFTKASVAAKDFGYTSDYIGQLCRAKKIDARLVGRTWFVNTDSIGDHKKTKKDSRTSLKEERRREYQASVAGKKRVIEPVLKVKTVRSVLDKQPTHEETRALRVSYNPDEEALLPHLTRKREMQPVRLDVNPAEAKRIKIHGLKKDTNFTPTELPEVSLKGSISVTEVAVEDTVETDDITSKNKATSAASSEENSTASTLPPVKKVPIAETKSTQVNTSPASATQKKTEKTPASSAIKSPSTFVPTAVTGVSINSPEASSFVRLILISSFTAALFVSIGLLTAVSEVTVSSSAQSAQLFFEAQNFIAIRDLLLGFFIHS